MNTHTIRPKGSHKLGVPGIVEGEYFCARGEKVRISPVWQIDDIDPVILDTTENQLELEV